MKLKIEKAVLVYQGGIANIFTVDEFLTIPSSERGEQRIYQGDFRTAETLVRGMRLAGVRVRTMVCNMAGDIAKQTWSTEIESAPFSEQFRS